MALFGKVFASSQINEKAQQAQNDASIYLVDVRSPEEFASGHIPGSINIPLDRIDGVASQIPDTSAVIYLYCASGARSGRAEAAMRALGYTDVENIGGISGWTGAIE